MANDLETQDDVVDNVVDTQNAVDTQVETPDVVDDKPVSIEDTIRSTFKRLSAKEEQTETPELQDPVKDATVKPVDKTVTPVGDFDHPFKRVTAEGKEYPVDISQPPNTWTKEGKAAFNQLPREVRMEIHKREEDFHSGITTYKQAAGFGGEIAQIVGPYVAQIKAEGSNVQNAISSLMDTAYRLRTGNPQQKAQMILNIAQAYGIDWNVVGQIHDRVSTGQPAVDPTVQRLEQKISQFEQQANINRDNAVRQQMTIVQSDIHKFATDPVNEHFLAVKDDMAALLESGQSTTLQDAYDKAIWANSTTRAKLLAKQQEEARRKTVEQAKNAKKAGSVNVQKKGTLPTNEKAGSIEDTIRNTYRKISGS